MPASQPYRIALVTCAAAVAATMLTLVPAEAQNDRCVALAGQFERAMMDEQLSVPASRSRNHARATIGASRVAAEQNRQAQALQLMRDLGCALPDETDSRIYALDAQECSLARIRGGAIEAQECDQAAWSHRLTNDMRAERGLPPAPPQPPPAWMLQ